MIITVDTNVLAEWFSKKNEDDVHRLNQLLDDLAKARGRLIIPTPCLSEFLVGVDGSGMEWLAALERRQSIVVASFDKRAAFECSLLDQAAIASGDKRGGRTDHWQKIKIDAAWSVALEAVLGARLNALISDDVMLETRPPASLVLGYRAGSNKVAATAHSKLTPLLSVIKECDAEVQPILADWLEGAWLLPAAYAIEKAIANLDAGEILVNQQGDVFGRHSVIYHGENSSLHGVLERQTQLDALLKNQPDLQEKLSTLTQQLVKTEASMQVVRQLQQHENNQLKVATNALYQAQLALSALQQAQRVATEREQSIQGDIATAQTRLMQLTQDKASKQAVQESLSAQLSQLETAKNSDLDAKQKSEQVYAATRDTMQLAEKTHQEIFYNKKLITNIINELNNKINVNNEEKTAFLHRQIEAEQTLTLTPMETLKANLAEAINVKQMRESDLTNARNHLAEAETQMQALERTRMQHEQQLHPMRDSVEQSRLKEQEARLYFEQCQASLQENGQNETELAKNLAENAKTSDLLRKTNQLQQDIAELGAVNLAAIQELASETERKSYLTSQMLDLQQATETLEDAIKKIDRETRDKLMQTFNIANQHFGELFSTLFGGGQAKLELLGDEILDTGLQVFAQPPGKKNTTIQLLSGGEKALTALALVFALFRLNPAPFCLMDEVDAPLDDSNTERFCTMVKKMAEKTQFLFVSHNKITMEMAQQLIGVTMQESGVSRIVDVDITAALELQP